MLPRRPRRQARAVSDLMPMLDRLMANVGSVVLGKPEVIRRIVVALLAEGHVLIEDVPGVGKTLLARAAAGRRSIDCSFPPAPVHAGPAALGHPGLQHLQCFQRRVPVQARADLRSTSSWPTRSIGRPPRTQSALLEAMGDGQVSVEGKTYTLEPPFLVLATQNPYEFEGTYVLPESQLDRFMMRLRMGYPDRSEERSILTSHRGGEPVEALRPVLTAEQVLQLQHAVRAVRVDDSVSDYLLDLVHASRECEDLHVGRQHPRRPDPLPGRAEPGVRRGSRLRRARRHQDPGRPPSWPTASSASPSSRPASSAPPRRSSATWWTGSGCRCEPSIRGGTMHPLPGPLLPGPADDRRRRDRNVDGRRPGRCGRCPQVDSGPAEGREA